MAKNSVSLGNIIDHVAATDIISGDIVEMGNLIGVAQTDIATGDTGAVAIAGVYDMPKAAGAAWAQGDSLVVVAGEFAAGGGPSVATADAGSSDTTGLVLLNGNSG